MPGNVGWSALGREGRRRRADGVGGGRCGDEPTRPLRSRSTQINLQRAPLGAAHVLRASVTLSVVAAAVTLESTLFGALPLRHPSRRRRWRPRKQQLPPSGR